MHPTRLFFHSTNRLFKNLAQAAACVLLTAGLVGGAGIASAQSFSASDGAESASARWLAKYDLQTAHQLRENPTVRTSVISVVIKQASEREALQLPQTAEALLHVVENSSNERERIMAIQALSEIGPEHVGELRYEEAMSRLYALGEEDPSEQVRGAVADAVKQYQAG